MGFLILYGLLCLFEMRLDIVSTCSTVIRSNLSVCPPNPTIELTHLYRTHKKLFIPYTVPLIAGNSLLYTIVFFQLLRYTVNHKAFSYHGRYQVMIKHFGTVPYLPPPTILCSHCILSYKDATAILIPNHILSYRILCLIYYHILFRRAIEGIIPHTINN